MSFFEGPDLKISKQARSLLFNLGMTGASNIPISDAQEMFEHLAQAEPEEPYIHFGLGFARMVEGDYEAAHESFTHPCLAGTVYEDNAKAHNAMAYFFDGEAFQGRQICDDLLANSSSDTVKDLARELLKNLG